MKTILENASTTLKLEAGSIQGLIDLLDDNFVRGVQFILDSNGRVVITGIGKSANIAKKIVATLNSTGTPSLFMHAADAIHGDLGMIQKDDVVICISKSGNTPEIKALIPLIKNMGNKMIGMVGNTNSFLASEADAIFNTTVKQEACPNNLAPTTSTTAQLALGDAVAVCLMKAKGFSSKNFAEYHPGGALGKRLYLKTGDLLDKNAIPTVQQNTPINEVILEISSQRKGATAVVESGKVNGIITDGDLRRMLEKKVDLNSICAKDIMNPSPKIVTHDELAVKAFETMESNSISQLIVLENDQYVGIVHLHDLLKEGIY